MKLVIVESPTKAKTIERFLGSDFTVTSSYGHIRDLPKSKMGIDIEGNFEPQYVIPTKARKTVNSLKKLAEKADEIILAMDEDREGEAIAWHIIKALELEDKGIVIKRIVFHEITKPAIEEALRNPRDLNKNLFNAQQARRILDRLVGYTLSPLLWKKVMRGLSAGRVQSIVLRLITEREKERKDFKTQEYWTLEACLRLPAQAGRQADLTRLDSARQEDTKDEVFVARLWKSQDKILKDLDLKNKKEVDKILESLASAVWKVADVKKAETRRNPSPPFTTSTLQQAANNRLRFSAKQTMVLAQQLYEGVDVGSGQEGLITYMRTDSLNVSTQSQAIAKDFIIKNYGESYSKTTSYKTKSKGAQEAHEAIRPTNPALAPATIKQYLDERQFKLYQLIWQRFVASQMTPAVFENTTAIIDTGRPYTFRSSGLVRKFDGFLKVWPQKSQLQDLPALSANEELSLVKLNPQKHETAPPPRYSEAALVKALEEFGIGRPSTYAPTMSTIQTRGYVEKDENRKFFPTEIGTVVNKLLVENFPNIVDINFTATMEKDLDEIAEGKKEWVPTIKEFYLPFAKRVEEKTETLEKEDFKKDTPTDKICPKCDKPIVIKFGRFGKFYACSGFPDCKHTETVKKTIGMTCPECNEGDVVIKQTKKRRRFWGCSRYPKCEYASWRDPLKKVEEK